MAFVNDEQPVVGEIIEQAKGACTGFSTVKIAAVVFDTGAITQLANHFEVIFYPLLQTFGLQRLAGFFKKLNLSHQIVLNVVGRAFDAFAGSYKKVGRIDGKLIHFVQGLSGKRINKFNGFNFVAPEINSNGIFGIGQKDVYGISNDSKGASFKLLLGSKV